MKKKLQFDSSSNQKKDRDGGQRSSKNQSFDYPGSKIYKDQVIHENHLN